MAATTADLQGLKAGGERITMVTAYDFPTARLAELAGVDALLVGDSVGTAVLGHQTTVPVTLAAMLHHCAAVTRAVEQTLVVADLPFLTYQVTVEEAMRNAARLIQEGGAAAVKLEGGVAIAPVVRRLSDIGVPVVGHVGLVPQSVHKLGGFRPVGRTPAEADQILHDARAIQEAGAFALVLESIPAELAERITRESEIPTIGIGAGPHCDGQVLVSYDAFGFFEAFVPRFVKRYAELGTAVTEAARQYASEVRSGAFPAPEHSILPHRARVKVG